MRIVNLGGEIEHGGVVAPGGGNYLKCARSLGDAPYKRGPREEHLICAEPELFTIELTPSDEVPTLPALPLLPILPIWLELFTIELTPSDEIPPRRFERGDHDEGLTLGLLAAAPLMAAEPAPFEYPRGQFVVVASDGVWDVFSDQRACEIVARALADSGGAADVAAKQLVQAALRAESEDNISAAVLLLPSARADADT